MSARIRAFEFDRGTPLGAAIRTIRAALEDEGLELAASDNTPGSRIWSVLDRGVERVIVPAHRIVAREDARG